MKQTGLILAILVLAMVAGTTVAGNDHDHDLTETLRQLVENKLAAFNREDVTATMQYIHTKSPEHGSTQSVLSDQFKVLDARTKLIHLRYIGHDDEFSVARVKFKTVNESGEPFAANVMDTITVFHMEDGVWKYWSDHILGVEFSK